MEKARLKQANLAAPTAVLVMGSPCYKARGVEEARGHQDSHSPGTQVNTEDPAQPRAQEHAAPPGKPSANASRLRAPARPCPPAAGEAAAATGLPGRTPRAALGTTAGSAAKQRRRIAAAPPPLRGGPGPSPCHFRPARGDGAPQRSHPGRRAPPRGQAGARLTCRRRARPGPPGAATPPAAPHGKPPPRAPGALIEEEEEEPPPPGEGTGRGATPSPAPPPLPPALSGPRAYLAFMTSPPPSFPSANARAALTRRDQSARPEGRSLCSQQGWMYPALSACCGRYGGGAKDPDVPPPSEQQRPRDVTRPGRRKAYWES